MAPRADKQAGVAQQLVTLALLHLLHGDYVSFDARLIAEIDEIGAAVRQLSVHFEEERFVFLREPLEADDQRRNKANALSVDRLAVAADLLRALVLNCDRPDQFVRELAVADLPAQARDPDDRLEAAAVLAQHEAIRLNQPLLHRLTVSDDRICEAANDHEQENVDKKQRANLDK